MNKSELVGAIAAKAGLTKVDAAKAINAFIDVTYGELKKGEKVSLVGFGTFSVNQRKARKGLNPQTKKAINIPAKKVARFKAGKGLEL